MPLGFHVGRKSNDKSIPIVQALEDAFKLLKEYDIVPAAQIFIVGPQNYKQLLTQQDKKDLRRLAKEFPIVIHGAYIDNPWKLRPGTIHNIKTELIISSEIESAGVIIHLGNNTNSTLETVLNKISTVKLKSKTTLWLEINSVKSSDKSFETPEKINALFDKIYDLQISNDMLEIGLCIDTAHLFSSGNSLNTYGKAQEYFESLSKNIPLLIHLNDSG